MVIDWFWLFLLVMLLCLLLGIDFVTCCLLVSYAWLDGTLQFRIVALLWLVWFSLVVLVFDCLLRLYG